MHRHQRRRERYNIFNHLQNIFDFPEIEVPGAIAVAGNALRRSMTTPQTPIVKRLRIMDTQTCDSGISLATNGTTPNNVVSEATGPWSHSSSRITLGRIPRGLYQDVRYEPRFSYLETGNLSCGSAANSTGIQTHEFWKGSDINYFMNQLIQWAAPDNTGSAPAAMVKEKVKGFVFQENFEYIMTNQTNVPVRIWILDYVWKRTARQFPTFTTVTTQTDVETTFESLWREGWNLDTNQATTLAPSEPPEENYGYTYGRSEPFKSYIRVAKRKELHLQPGQTHIHSVNWNINRVLDMMKITQIANWDSVQRKYAGLTHGTAFIQHGTVGASLGFGGWGLLPTEIGVVWRRSLNMTMRAREMGKTLPSLNLNRSAAMTTNPLINPLTGEQRPFESTGTVTP